RHRALRDTHSFPTRRSSDLALQHRVDDPGAERFTGAYVLRVLLGLLPEVRVDEADRRQLPRCRVLVELVDLRDVAGVVLAGLEEDRKSTRLNSSHRTISYAV